MLLRRKILRTTSKRGIDTSRIEDAINDPASQMPADGPGKRKYVGRPYKDGTQLVVIASDPPSSTGCVTIVTCYYRSQS